MEIIINRNIVNSVIKPFKEATLTANKAYVELYAMREKL